MAGIDRPTRRPAGAGQRHAWRAASLAATVTRAYAAETAREDGEQRFHLRSSERYPRQRPGMLPHDLGAPNADPFVRANDYAYQDSSRWKDLNAMFVLCAWRDAMRDPALAAEFYPPVKQAMEALCAFDGDGDRVLMIDHKGEVLDGDELIYIIARQQHKDNALRGGVVGTLMSNLGMELALNALDIPFERAQVGDRYVLEELVKQGWLLGGESSGHIICLDKATTGDGIVAALQVLGAMTRSGHNLHELKQSMTKMPQTMVNVRLAERCDPTQDQAVQKAVVATEQRLGDQGRVLLRMSGTEPLVRVMVEGEDAALVNQLANELADSVKKAMG